jgi:hypothetical protein
MDDFSESKSPDSNVSIEYVRDVLKFLNQTMPVPLDKVAKHNPIVAFLQKQASLPAPDQIKMATPKRPKFRGPLADVLFMAWQQAEHRTSSTSIFNALVRLATCRTPPDPLCGYDSQKKAVKWREWNDKTKKPDERYFTRKNMHSRFRATR